MKNNTNTIVKTGMQAVGKEALQFFADHPEVVIAVAEKAVDVAKDGFNANGERKKNRHELEKRVIDGMLDFAMDSNNAPEDRKTMCMEAANRLDKAYEEDEKDREHEKYILEMVIGTVVGGPAFWAVYLGYKQFRK